jgi:hypothetical protein
MATAEHREPCDLRGSCTVLGARGGEIPPRDSTKPDKIRCLRHVRSAPDNGLIADIAVGRLRAKKLRHASNFSSRRVGQRPFHDTDCCCTERQSASPTRHVRFAPKGDPDTELLPLTQTVWRFQCSADSLAGRRYIMSSSKPHSKNGGHAKRWSLVAARCWISTLIKRV